MSTVHNATENLSEKYLLWCANDLNRYNELHTDPQSHYVANSYDNTIEKKLPNGGYKIITEVTVDKHSDPAVFIAEESEVKEQ